MFRTRGRTSLWKIFPENHYLRLWLAVLREPTCHQQINRRLNKVFGNLVAAILVINYGKASVNL